MKRKESMTLFALITLCAGVAFAQQGVNLEVVVKNVKGTKGNIRVGLFTNEESFLKTPAEGKIVKATEGTVTVQFTDLNPGDYAISVIHDANENGKLDSNGLGIPKEGFAFGNNAMGSFGPPSFEKAKVAVTAESLTCTVDMKYY
ncbi:DUF2141 domain-containing protein [Chryseolinea lacunae]|uniref:DUF2141 domain-containing protein n=1 Tax=Chryseolinea lacunae TaxID=2801331 RepID=A0ABS1KSE5_9BACT|nr:DUF2141 domain-containing protein [Chryseolinea lacunae]MBL0742398.1 DUF2141 domain-containing protein [Chryseolinea lacunae]